MVDYLDWLSDISLEQVFAGSDGFSHPTIAKDLGTIYLTSIKAEKSRSALMFIPEGQVEAICITPKLFSLQTKVNEYGGKPYWLNGAQLLFSNASDQCLYSQDLLQLGSEPKRVSLYTDEHERLMYTDVHQVNKEYAIAITERKSTPENVMTIAALNLDGVSVSEDLIQGADFYSNLVINQSSTRVAWVEWQHPNMPWDANELWVAELGNENGELQLNAKENIKLPEEFGRDACICQLLFANNGCLFFSADFHLKSSPQQDSRNYWNVYQYDIVSKRVTSVTQGQGEYGYPHWVYGDHRIVQLDQQRLLTVVSHPHGDALTIINQDTLSVEERPIQSATLQHLSANGVGKAVLMKLPNDANGSLIELDFTQATQPERVLVGDNLDIVSSTSNASDLSLAEHIAYPTKDGQHAYGFYYPPANESYQTDTVKFVKPPLLVMVHGGPTARAYGHFDLQKQFWTSRGFAILDVNHRGSSGYGRAYRDALYGEWGNIDARDIIDGIEHLVKLGKADPSRVCIRGKSAGGYAVLRALTEYPETFKVGACYYGIGNLVTLAETTHKFEKHYTDRLIDETFDSAAANSPSSRFYQRSPINKIDQVGSAMIVFQGALDKVVPPSVAQEVVNALQAAELDYEYVEYSDEAHGFRQVANNIDAWSKELAFYQRVLKSKQTP